MQIQKIEIWNVWSTLFPMGNSHSSIHFVALGLTKCISVRFSNIFTHFDSQILYLSIASKCELPWSKNEPTLYQNRSQNIILVFHSFHILIHRMQWQFPAQFRLTKTAIQNRTVNHSFRRWKPPPFLLFRFFPCVSALLLPAYYRLSKKYFRFILFRHCILSWAE